MPRKTPGKAAVEQPLPRAISPKTFQKNYGFGATKTYELIRNGTLQSCWR
jgi:hypothetical protein